MKNRKSQKPTHSHQNSIRRRDFLSRSLQMAGLGFSFNPFDFVAQNIALGFISEAQAGDQNPQQPGYFLNLFMFGAVDQSFYLPLSLSDENFDPENPGCISEWSLDYQSGERPRYKNHQYRLANGHELLAPVFWKTGLPLSTGSHLPAYKMLEKAMIFRGMTVRTEEHLEAAKNNYNGESPVSLLGAMGDASRSPLQSVHVGGPPVPDQSFRSKQSSVRFIQTPTDELLKQILSPFDTEGDTPKLANQLLKNQDQMESAYQNAVQTMNRFLASRQAGVKKIEAEKTKALNLIRSGLQGYQAEYNTLVAKYLNLIGQCAGQDIIGITDFNNRVDLSNSMYGRDRALGDMSINNPNIISTGLLRDHLNSTAQIPLLAQYMAAAEYLFKNDLTRCILMAVQPPKIGSIQPGPNDVWEIDEHFHSPLWGIVFRSYLYRSLLTCMNEFQNALNINNSSGENISDHLVMALNSEFGRMHRRAQASETGYYLGIAGSDHLGNGANSLLFSKKLDKLHIVGNLKENPSSIPDYAGKVGLGDTVRWLDGSRARPLDIRDWMGTVAYLVGSANPSLNHPSLIAKNNSNGYDLLTEFGKESY